MKYSKILPKNKLNTCTNTLELISFFQLEIDFTKKGDVSFDMQITEWCSI